MEIKKNISKDFLLKNILFLFFILLFYFIIKKLWLAKTMDDPYTIGDWLINYQDGGFKRRGLSGSVFFLIQDLTGLSLQFLVFGLQSLLYFLFLTILILVTKKRLITINYILMALSPVTFLFYIHNPQVIGRKEIILFLIFIIYLWLLWKGKMTKNKENIIVFIVFISILFHELTLFYIPYFVFAKYVFNGKIDKYLVVKLLIVTIISFALIRVFGSEINNGNSIEILSQRNFIIEKNYGGIFTWNINPIEYISENISKYILYIVPLTVGLLTIILNIQKLKPESIYYVFLLTSLIWSLPIFYLATDWGRWLNIHFILLFTIVTFILPEINVSCHKHKTEYTIRPIHILIFIFNILIQFRHYKDGLLLIGF